MGSRMLRRWMVFPLKDVRSIDERLEVVENFFRETELKRLLEEKLSLIGDLERIISKAAVGRISPREVVQLKVALMAIEPIREAFLSSDNAVIRGMGEKLDPCSAIRDRIEREIVPDPPVQLNKGGVIRKGVDEQLDELRNIAFSGKDYLLQLQQQKIDETGIPSLKIAFNNSSDIISRCGIPTRIRRTPGYGNTLVNAERYITEELKA